MCQELTLTFSCGCVKEQVSVPCKDPRSSCTQQKYFLARVPLDEACPEHRDHPAFRTTPYTYKQGWTVLPAAISDLDRAGTLPDHSRRTIRQRAGYSKLNEQVGPRLSLTQSYQAAVPKACDIDDSKDNCATMASGSRTLSRSRSDSGYRHSIPGRSPGVHAPSRIPNNPSLSGRIPRRKPVAADVLSIPVYDNGTDAALKAAEALKRAKSNKIDAGYETVARTTREQSSKSTTRSPPTSFPSTTQRQSSQRNNRNYPNFRADEYHDPSLFPAPLDINRSGTQRSTSGRSSGGVMQASYTDRYGSRPLPATPPPASSDQTWGQATQRQLHEAHRQPARTPEVSRIYDHEDARQAYQERQASQIRVLNAKRAIDSGRYAKQTSCPEIEVLTREERRSINQYIQKKRDAEQEQRAVEKRDREMEAKKVEELNRSQSRRKKNKLCKIM